MGRLLDRCRHHVENLALSGTVETACLISGKRLDSGNVSREMSLGCETFLSSK